MATTYDDDPNFPSIGIRGGWEFINIATDSTEYSHDFEKGLISWTFTESYRTLFVFNKNKENSYSGLRTLNYGNTNSMRKGIDSQ